MRKRNAVLLISFLAAVSLAFGVVALINTTKLKKLEYAMRVDSERAFSELCTDMAELSNNLEKSIYISDPSLQSALCTQIYGCSTKAQMAMASLPYASYQIEQAADFLSRVGDYACVLSRSINREDGFSRDEWNNLSSLSDTASVLYGNLQDLQTQLSNGTLSMDVANASQSALQSKMPLLSDSISSIEQEFPELPSLIYDGPFSDGIRRDKPLLLEGLSEIDEQQACAVAAKMLNVDEKSVECVGECQGDVPCWQCRALLSGGEYRVRVTKQGGLVYSLLSSRIVGNGSYEAEEALEMASELLKRMGLENMKQSYYMIQDGVLTVNFEYEQDGVLCYPDLIKVGIALDSGMLQSYDASGYIAAHTERQWPENRISEEEAAEKLPKTLRAEKSALTLIPRDGGEETLCYEFLCSTENERRCLIYINAETGAQERIMLLLEDENGTLTI